MRQKLEFEGPLTSPMAGRRFLQALVLTCFAFPVATAFVLGAWNVPFADDWAYLRIAETFVRSGRIVFVGWNDIALVGELPLVRLAALVGKSFGHYRLVTVAAALVIVWAHLRLQRTILPSGWAWIGTLGLVVWPGFATSVVTFMTDLPALAAELVSLVLVVGACANARFARLRFIGAVAVAAWGMTIRQNALAAVVTVLVVGLVWPHLRKTAMALVPLVGVATLVFSSWRSGFANAGSVRLSPAVLGPSLDLATMAILAGLICSPLVAQLVFDCRGETGRLLRKLRPTLFIVAFAVAGMVGIVASGREMFLGNTLTPYGPLGVSVLSGSKPRLFPMSLWWVLIVVAVTTLIVSTCAVLAFLPRQWLDSVRSLRSEAVVKWMLARPAIVACLGFAGSSLGLLVVAVFLTPALFDRYALGFVASAGPLFIVVLRRCGLRRIGVTALVGFTGLVVLTMASVWDAQSFSSARWKLAERFVAEKGDPETIDAGFEWVGAHYRGIAQPERFGFLPGQANRNPFYYLGAFPRFHRSATIVAEQTDDWRQCLLEVSSYSQWFGLRNKSLYLYVVPVDSVLRLQKDWSCRAKG